MNNLTIFDFLSTTTKFERFLAYFTEWSKEKGKIGEKKSAEMIASDLKKIKAAHTKNKRGFGN